MIETENSSCAYDEHIINPVEISTTIGIDVKKQNSFFNSDSEDYSSEMKGYNQWVLSRLKAKADGTYTKIPCNANGYYCDCTDPNNCMSFEKAFEICEANPDKFSGIGFSVSSSGTIKAIDCDHVYDHVTGEWNQQALQELRSLNTRVEWSPSHTGIHLFFTCPIMLENGKKIQPDGTGREMYFEKHYLTVTGEVVEGFTDVINKVDPELITQLYDKWFPAKTKPDKAEAPVKSDTSNVIYMPETPINDPNDPLQNLPIVAVCVPRTNEGLVEVCKSAPCGFGKSFVKLMAGDTSDYEFDESDGDIALAGMIAHHTPNYDQIKSIIKMSKLWDEKWEREDYCRNTITKAIANSRWGNANQIATVIPTKTNIVETVVPELKSDKPDDIKTCQCPESTIEPILPNGYIVTEKGVIMLNYGKDGVVTGEVPICHSPIKLTGVSQDIDTHEISYEVSYTDSLGHWHKGMYKQSELITGAKLKATQLADQINLIDTQISNLCKYFNKCVNLNARSLPRTITVSKYGWRKEESFVIGNKMITKDGVTPVRPVENDNALIAKGSLDEWIKAVKPIINDDTVRFKCYCTLTSMLLELLNVQSFFVHHSGDSSQGKTFGYQVAVSMYGDPINLMLAANSSPTFIEMKAAACNHLPLFLDETSLQLPEVLTQIIYMVANESGRGRATNAKLQAVNRWKTVALTTGELPIVSTNLNGATARVITFETQMEIQEPLVVEDARKSISKNSGHIIDLYMTKVLQNKEELKIEFQDLQRKLMHSDYSTLVNRSASTYAAIAIAGLYLEKVFADIGIPAVDPEDLIRKFFNEAASNPTEPYKIKALRNLYGYVEIHRNSFIQNDNDLNLNREIFGYISDEYIDLFPKIARDALQEGGYNDSVINEWIKDGIVIVNAGRKDYRLTIKGSTKKPNVYRFDVKKLLEKLEN